MVIFSGIIGVMDVFSKRYNNLNDEQKTAVDTIDGPLIVVAGPGTGKTELLSMRTANILRKTDTLPENILCLTFTDSGAVAMRSRLSEIIGPDAYRVAIQTFHSFGTEITNQYNSYFFRGAQFRPADELSSYEILKSIFDELDHANPLTSKMAGEYTYLRDAMTAISELKQAGLPSEELRTVVTANETALDSIEPELQAIFSQKININMLKALSPIAEKIATFSIQTLPPAILPLNNNLSLSLAHALSEAIETGKTTPITAWRNRWMEKNIQGDFIFKDRKRHAKLLSLAHVYDCYVAKMEQAKLYDYDDMILNAIQAMETYPDLRFNLQEKYQYIMVDEFQDTNLAQMRILFNLTNTTLGDSPNIMVVGDDDQAIYSFQGADVGNIHRFRQEYPTYKTVSLIHNYRSCQAILDHAREVIIQADGRLENSMEISKKLIAHATAAPTVNINHLETHSDEYAWVADAIAGDIASGTKPESIAVLARRHQELIELLPYLASKKISVNYERRDNVLDLECITTLELLANIVIDIAAGQHSRANSRLPELLAHPMYKYSAESIWRLSLTAHRNNHSWLEAMMGSTEFKPLADWLVESARDIVHKPLEEAIDRLIGIPAEKNDQNPVFISPYYNHYFGDNTRETNPEAYLTTLEALRTIRTKLREYRPDSTLHLNNFIEFIQTYRQLGATIASVRNRSTELDGAINLMTAHKSKGLEFDTVYVINSIDSVWGERVRSRSRLISYPENLPIMPNADTYDERLRLYYVAMTRAKRQLHLTFSSVNDAGKDTLIAGFLTGTTISQTTPESHHSLDTLTAQAELSWHERLTDQPTASMKQLLTPVLERYKLSSTHLNNFIDITHGGPATFLTNNLLRFPQAKSPHAGYGTAIHATLQRAHNYLVAHGERRPVKDVLDDFTNILREQRLDDTDFALFSKRGVDNLTRFLETQYDTFSANQKTELSFANQGVIIDGATLTGSLDLVEIVDNHITVTDYKTGKPSYSWKGKTDAEKIKLHKYRQQLMFYQLLCNHSRDYAKYQFKRGILQFVEPDNNGELHALEEQFSQDDLVRFTKLINAVWHCITTLELPDVKEFEQNYRGVLAFEDYLIDKYSK